MFFFSSGYSSCFAAEKSSPLIDSTTIPPPSPVESVDRHSVDLQQLPDFLVVKIVSILSDRRIFFVNSGGNCLPRPLLERLIGLKV